jgi:hypothetical protein
MFLATVVQKPSYQVDTLEQGFNKISLSLHFHTLAAEVASASWPPDRSEAKHLSGSKEETSHD